MTAGTWRPPCKGLPDAIPFRAGVTCSEACRCTSTRRAWWAVELRDPAPLLCTCMARRPPASVKNPCRARHLNIAHGIYPREPLADETLDALSHWLQQNVDVSGGRTYAGGLTKFEPREIEHILVPPPERLHDRTTDRRGTGPDVFAARMTTTHVLPSGRPGGDSAPARPEARAAFSG